MLTGLRLTLYWKDVSTGVHAGMQQADDSYQNKCVGRWLGERWNVATAQNQGIPTIVKFYKIEGNKTSFI